MSLLQQPVAAPPVARAGRRWRRVLAVALVVLAAAATAGWQWAARSPQLERGSSWRPVGVQAVGDGFEDTRYVVPPEGGRLLVSVRNTGPVAVTLAAAREPYPEDAPLSVEGFRPGSDGPALTDDAPLRRTVEVGPDDEAVVAVRFAHGRCTPVAEGSSLTLVDLPLRVTTLGTTSERRYAVLPLPVTLPGPHEPAPGCR